MKLNPELMFTVGSIFFKLYYFRGCEYGPGPVLCVLMAGGCTELHIDRPGSERKYIHSYILGHTIYDGLVFSNLQNASPPGRRPLCTFNDDGKVQGNNKAGRDIYALFIVTFVLFVRLLPCRRPSCPLP